jgi:hypothetical protein
VAIILEVKAGPMSGEKIVVRTGQTVTFGRVPARANFALPYDTVMSGLHFAVECGSQGPLLKDQNSTNGTFLNGAKIKDSPLTNGDEIRTGQTSFLVRLIADDKLAQSSAAAPSAPVMEARATARPDPQLQPTPPPAIPVAAPAIPRPTPPIPPAPPAPVPTPVPPTPQPPPPPIAAVGVRASSTAKPALFNVGSWAFSLIPQGWTVKAEFGMEQAEKEGFPSSVTATEEMIGGNPVLGPFVESQLSMLRQYLREPKIEAVIPPAIPGADEKAAVDVRYSTNDGQIIFYRRLYARSGNTVGTITLMTLDKEFASVRPAFDAIVGGVAFQVKALA